MKMVCAQRGEEKRNSVAKRMGKRAEEEFYPRKNTKGHESRKRNSRGGAGARRGKRKEGEFCPRNPSTSSGQETRMGTKEEKRISRGDAKAQRRRGGILDGINRMDRIRKGGAGHGEDFEIGVYRGGRGDRVGAREINA